MYKLLITCFFSLLFIQDDRYIAWNEEAPLTWAQFNDTPTYGTTVAAVTASGITFGFTSKMTGTRLVDYDYEITAHFYPDKSWYVKGRANEVVLDHERLHFDITELHARKFKQRIAQTRFDLRINDQMEAIHTKITEELRQMQKTYDAESDHSQHLENQLMWQRFVKLELQKLNYYK